MKVDIAIITIREDEFTAVRSRFQTTRQRIPGGRTYLIGEVKTHDGQTYTIAIARCSDQGTDASQRLAHSIIHHLDPQLILVVGIAGGIPHDEFTLGDVVVSTRIVNPNVDAWLADGTIDYMMRGGPPHPVVEEIVSLLPGEPQLAGWTDSIRLERPRLDPEQADIKGDEGWRERVRKSLAWHFGEEQNRGRSPTFTIGPILSSNHLIKDPVRLGEILKTHRAVLAVEMEAAGVYEAAYGTPHYPVLAIRGISDIVGLQRDRRWTAYACQTAAAFTYAFIMTTPIDLRKPLDFFTETASIYDPAIPSQFPNPQDFVGRDELLAQLKHRLLSSQSVVITALRGLPGVGKTALAIELTHTPEIQKYFHDGILWAGVGRDPNIRETLTRWGKLLGLSGAEMAKLSGEKEWALALRTAIGKRRLLLVIDDVWKLEDALAFRFAGPSCQYLITTRFRSIATSFGREEEVQVPELNEDNSITLLGRFVPQLVKQDLQGARELVRAVGGLPLALRLMGRYLLDHDCHVATALEKLRQVEERLRLSETLGELDRHPSIPGATISLQAAIEVSDEDLRDDTARQALRAYSVFPSKPNTFSEEAALAVAATSADVFDYLVSTGLVEISSKDVSSKQNRYTMHQTIADYAKVRRTEGTVEKRIADYFAQYVDTTSKVSEWALNIDEANINEALRLAHNRAYDKLVVKLCMGMRNFWRNGGRRDASLRYLPWGIQAAKEIAKATQQREDYLTEADLTYTYGQVLFQTGNPGADQAYRDSLAIYQKIGEQEKEGMILSALGRHSLSRGQMKEAEDYCQRALKVHRAIGSELQMGVDLSSLAQIAIDCGHLEKADRYLQQAAPTRLQGRGRRIDCIELGRIAIARKNLEEAESYFQEALEISQNRAGKEMEMDRRGEAASFNWLGLVALDRGQLEEAKTLLQKALGIHREVQDLEGEAQALFRFALLAEIQGDLESAEKKYEESLKIFRSAQLDRLIPNTLLEFGRFLVEQRRNREAGCSMLLQAAQLYAQMGIHSAKLDLPSEQKAQRVAQRLGCSNQEPTPTFSKGIYGQ